MKAGYKVRWTFDSASQEISPAAIQWNRPLGQFPGSTSGTHFSGQPDLSTGMHRHSVFEQRHFLSFAGQYTYDWWT